MINSFRKNLVFSAASSLISQGCEWIALLIIIRSLGLASFGQYAYSLTIFMPVLTLLSLNTRGIQLVDSNDEHSHLEFIVIQSLSSALAILLSCSIALFSSDSQNIATFLLLCLAASIQAIREVFITHFQKGERLDLFFTCKSLGSILYLLTVTSTTTFTNSLFVLSIGIAGSRIASLIFIDIPLIIKYRKANTIETHPNQRLRWDSVRQIIRKGTPLGINSGITIMIDYLPRLILADIANKEQLGIFVALMSLVSIPTVFFQAVSNAYVPRIAKSRLVSSISFVKNLTSLTTLGLIIGISFTVPTILFPKLILTTLFGDNYSGLSFELQLIAMYSICVILSSCVGIGLTSLLQFRIQPYLSFLTLAILAPLCFHLTQSRATEGSILAIIASRIAYLTIAYYFLNISIQNFRNSQFPPCS